MKTVLLLLLFSGAGLLSGCNRSDAAAISAAPAVEAATYKAGYGLQLSPEAARLVQLEVGEAALRPLPDGELPAVPEAAVLRTVRGDFVFVQNGSWLLRTPVRLAGTQAGWTGIAEGLYDGDRVAVRGVRALWLAELQAVNGGVGCADGH